MRIVVGTPYRENSITAIARAAASHEYLQLFFTTLYLASWQRHVQRYPFIGQRLGAELGRRAFPGIPSRTVVNLASPWELMYVGARRSVSREFPNVVARLMYQVKVRFDAAAARRLRRETVDVYIGMYGASRDSFKTIRRQGGLAVLNFVNSHPVDQNRYLVDLAGVKPSHHECIPAWMVRRVEEELDLADLVLVASRFVAEQLENRGLSPEKLAILPYGVDLRAFYPPERLAPAQSRTHSLECLYVGQICHRKGIRTLLKAADRCRDIPVKFRLIGPLISRDILAEMPDNVRYDGLVSAGEGVAQAMRQADCFVLPSLDDACGLVVLEAMACGLPVVATTQTGAAEFINSGENGLIVPAGDAQGLADAVGQLVEHREWRRRVGEAAHKRIKTQGAHSWQAYGENVLAAIEKRL